MTRFFLPALLALACQTVLGHYQLTYPPSRGFDESKEVTGPCGGFDSVSANRTDFPLKDGFMEINSEHPKYTYKVNIAIGNKPAAADFTSVVGQGQVAYPSQSCLQVDLSSVKNATDGTPATLQIIYMAGDGNLYQCADVTLKNQASNFNTSACVNADGSSPSKSGSSSGSQPSSTSAATTVKAGAMGAVAALVLSIAATA